MRNSRRARRAPRRRRARPRLTRPAPTGASTSYAQAAAGGRWPTLAQRVLQPSTAPIAISDRARAARLGRPPSDRPERPAGRTAASSTARTAACAMPTDFFRRVAAATAARAAPPFAAERRARAGEKLLSLAAVEARLQAIAPLLDDGAELAALVERARGGAAARAKTAHSSHSGPLVRLADWNACWKADAAVAREAAAARARRIPTARGLLGGVAQLLGVGELAALTRRTRPREASSPPPRHRSAAAGAGGGGQSGRGRGGASGCCARSCAAAPLAPSTRRRWPARTARAVGAAEPAGSAVASPLVAASGGGGGAR